jgi:hypothetical protein
MRETHGIAPLIRYRTKRLKQEILLFDKLLLWDLYNREAQASTMSSEELAELDFLFQSKLIDPRVIEFKISPPGSKTTLVRECNGVFKLTHRLSAGSRRLAWPFFAQDICSRVIAAESSADDPNGLVPICYFPLPKSPTGSPILAAKQTIIRVAISSLPTPDENCPWQDILDFKAEMRDKQWAFRRFLHTLATRQQTEAEIRDDIEWSLNQYKKAMEIYHLKSSDSFIEAFVIPLIEVVENLVKLNWSKIAKGAVSVRKRKAALMEAEMNAPGRECAYLFETQKRFARK